MSTGTYLDHLDEPGFEDVDETELDFGAGFASTDVPLTERAAAQSHGVSAAAEVLRSSYVYPGWTCDCPKPTRHVMTPAGVIILGREIKQGRTDVVDVEQDETAPCPTWRRTEITWTRPPRRWPGQPEPAGPVELEPLPSDPACTLEGPRPLAVSDIPKRWSGKSLLEYAAVQAWARGRLVDDGPVVDQLYLSGRDPVPWRAVWTDGAFTAARCGGRSVNLAELRSALKERPA